MSSERVTAGVRRSTAADALGAGDLHAIQAFMKGKVKVKGKIMLLQKAEATFRARDGYGVAKAAIGMAKL